MVLPHWLQAEVTKYDQERDLCVEQLAVKIIKNIHRLIESNNFWHKANTHIIREGKQNKGLNLEDARYINNDVINSEKEVQLQNCRCTWKMHCKGSEDNINTAKAITKECGILTNDGLCGPRQPGGPTPFICLLKNLVKC